MSAVKGVNVTKYDAGGQGDNAVDQGLVNARPEVWTDTYEAAALTAASTIDVAKLPAGAKVHSVEMFFDALGASSTIAIGDSDSTARYLAATSTAAAGSAKSNKVDGVGYEVGTADGDDVIQLLTAGASITGTIKVVTTFTR